MIEKSLHPEDNLSESPEGLVFRAKLNSHRLSILLFIKDMWGLTPQRPKLAYMLQWEEVLRSTGETWERLKDTVTADWFGDPINEDKTEWKWVGFEKGKNISWQQTLILLGVEKAANGEAKRKISTVSGHGIGKSATCSWIILWFLYCFYQSQVPVTAPTSHQMHDVLWKELSLWINRMPDGVKKLFEWQSDYVRMRYDPESWFARARTSTKENTEAIAGVHADHVCIVVDEASGVPEQVFNTAEGALTSGNTFIILISNGTQTTGYFFDSHHKNKADWQTFSFNSEQSPLVSHDYIVTLATRHGRDGEEYKIRAKGGFPGEDMLDDSGYVQLIPPNKIIVMTEDEEGVFQGRCILGIDPAGEGKDKASFWIRDRFKAKKVHELLTSNPKQIAAHALTLVERFNIAFEDIVVDSFGCGSDIGKEIAVATKGKGNPYTVLVGNAPTYEEVYNATFRRYEDELDEGKTDIFLNLRALMFFRARKWLIAGGVILDASVENSSFKNQMTVIKYKRTLQGNKIQLMSKKEMQKLRIPSPNDADAFALTFLINLDDVGPTKEEIEKIKAEDEGVDDPYAVV
jgi:hypothetical protein